MSALSISANQAEISEHTAKVNHTEWDALLQKYVNNTGNVNYAALKSDQANLNNYLKIISQNTPQSNWTKSEKLAYWINAYNAFTIKLIVDNYPVKSIKDLKGGNPWDEKWIKIREKTYSLNNIENDIIRPTFKEPRIHFAVNCAAASCPPLLNKAWTAQNLEANLANQTRQFINNTKYNQLSSSAIKVSKIFDWYGGDFGNLISYLNKYTETPIKSNAKVSFAEYDWSLNEQ